MIKTLNKLKTEGNFNLIKGVYNKVTANTILNDEGHSSPRQVGAKHGRVLPSLCSTVSS